MSQNETLEVARVVLDRCFSCVWGDAQQQICNNSLAREPVESRFGFHVASLRVLSRTSLGSNSVSDLLADDCVRELRNRRALTRPCSEYRR